MKVRYSKGTQSITADIRFGSDVMAAIGKDCKMEVAYDPADRCVYAYPANDGSPGRRIGEGWKPGEWRISGNNEALPPSGTVEVDATISGDILMFQLPQDLPQARTVHRTPKAPPLTPQGIVEAFQAAMAEYPSVKIKVLIPGVGLVAIRPEVMKVME